MYKGIPTICLVDTDCDPDPVDIPIPALIGIVGGTFHNNRGSERKSLE